MHGKRQRERRRRRVRVSLHPLQRGRFRLAGWKVIDLAASLLTRCISILSACLRKPVSILAVVDARRAGRSRGTSAAIQELIRAAHGERGGTRNAEAGLCFRQRRFFSRPRSVNEIFVESE